MRCIRVGRRHTFYRALDLLTSCACTDLSAVASTTELLNAAHLSRHGLDSKLCQLEGTEMIRPPLMSLASLLAPFVVLRLSHRRATCWLLSHPWMTTSIAPSLAHAALGRSRFPCPRRATSSLLQDFSSPSSKGCSSGGHFLFLLLLVLSRSYSLYSDEHFLLYVFVI